jgi:uncharacterized OsmC-like protein
VGNISAEIEKVMASNPRRVSEIHIALKIQNMDYTEREKTILEQAALTCPVAKSLSPEIAQEISFRYSE